MDCECHQLAAGGPSSLKLPSRSRPCGEVSRLEIRAPITLAGRTLTLPLGSEMLRRMPSTGLRSKDVMDQG